MAISLGTRTLPQEPQLPRFFFTVEGNGNSKEVIRKIDELRRGGLGQEYLCVVFENDENVGVPPGFFSVAVFDSSIGRRQLKHLLPSSPLLPAWGKAASRGVAISSAHCKVERCANQIFGDYVKNGRNGPRLGRRRGWEDF